MKKNRSHEAAALLSFLALVLAVVLEALPYGVTMRFAKGPGECYLETFSYFSLLPVGYADVLPMLIGILTAAACLALGICLLTGGKGKKPALVLGTIGAVLAVLRLTLYRGYENGTMWAVTVLLVLAWVLQFLNRRTPEKTE